MENQEEKVGEVTLSYNKNTGTMYSKFTPSMNVMVRKEDLSLVTDTSEEVIEEQIKKTVAKWFSKVSDIELADKFSTKLDIQSVECKYYSSGELKTARYDIVFKTTVNLGENNQ